MTTIDLTVRGPSASAGESSSLMVARCRPISVSHRVNTLGRAKLDCLLRRRSSQETVTISRSLGCGPSQLQVGAIVAIGSGARGREDLRKQVLAVGWSWSTAQRRLVRLVVELDRSGDWALDGARTCAHWVASALDVEVCTAREWLRIGRLLLGLPVIDAAFSAGRLSYSKVRALTRVATPETEGALCELAERTSASQLSMALAAWLAGHEEPEDTERRQHQARSLTWRLDPDGMVVGTFRLPPQMAAVLVGAISSWIRRWRPRRSTEREADASTAASSPQSVAVWPTLPQQRADALVALVEGGGTQIATEVVLHVRGDGCALDDGTPVAGSVVERIAPESFIRVLIHDAQRRPINASGRHRHPTTRQKRVVHERDRGCVDCGSTEFLEQDHNPAFEVSHRTIVDELEDRCWACHRARHRADRRTS